MLLADFPIMDPAPQRGLVAGMLRTMGNIITGAHSGHANGHAVNTHGCVGYYRITTMAVLQPR